MTTRWWHGAADATAKRPGFQKSHPAETALTVVTVVVLIIGVLIFGAWAIGGGTDALLLWGTSVLVCGVLTLSILLALVVWRAESRMQTMAICEAVIQQRPAVRD